MSVEIVEFSQEELKAKHNAGVAEHYDENSLPKNVDCGDKRVLTADSASNRNSVPGRFFGGVYGLAWVAVNAYGMQSDTPYRDIKEFLEEHEGGLNGVASDLSEEASKDDSGIDLYFHSSIDAENDACFINTQTVNDIGCALMANIGSITHSSGSEEVRTHAHIINEYDQGHDEEVLDEAVTISSRLLTALGGQETKISRDEVVAVVQNELYTPHVILEGSSKIDDETRVIMDLAGFAMNANGKDYVHSVPLAQHVITKLMPHLKLDEETIHASSIVLGAATQQTLGVRTTEVIPANAAV